MTRGQKQVVVVSALEVTGFLILIAGISIGLVMFALSGEMN